jgi:hypothetical protein
MGGESAKQVATTGLSEPERGSRPFDASTGRERAPRGDEKRRDAPAAVGADAREHAAGVRLLSRSARHRGRG